MKTTGKLLNVFIGSLTVVAATVFHYTGEFSTWEWMVLSTIALMYIETGISRD